MGFLINKNSMRLTKYIKETQGEIKNIVWPTRNDTIIHSALVIVISLVIGLAMGALDLGFQELLGKITSL